MNKTAIIVVDVQNDFCEGGSLAVEGGAQVARSIGEYLRYTVPADTPVVFTKDWHTPGSDNGGHFSDTPDYVDTWPHHCVAGTEGAQFHPAVTPGVPEDATVFLKGQEEPAYSGFQGFHEGIGLADYLKTEGVTDVKVCGIAADYCVRATMEDARKEGFGVELLTDLTVGIHKTGEMVAQEFAQA